MITLGDRIRDLVIEEGLDSACSEADAYEETMCEKVTELENEIKDLREKE